MWWWGWDWRCFAAATVATNPAVAAAVCAMLAAVSAMLTAAATGALVSRRVLGHRRCFRRRHRRRRRRHRHPIIGSLSVLFWRQPRRRGVYVFVRKRALSHHTIFAFSRVFCPWHQMQLSRWCACPDHPYHKFGTGNSSTLCDVPEKRVSLHLQPKAGGGVCATPTSM